MKSVSVLALALYRSESLSRAALLAQMPLVDFMQHISRLGIPVVRGDAQTLRDDIEDLDAWLERER
jgi:predicted HTH domain antitoxin